LLDGSPQPFHEDVIKASASSVHTDLHVVSFQDACELRAGEMAALVGIEYLRLVFVLFKNFFQTLKNKINIQSAAQFPIQNVAGEPVNDSDEIGKTFFQSNVSDVGTPYLVGFYNIQIAQEIRIRLMILVCITQILLRINGLNAHYPHKFPDMTPSDGNMMSQIQFSFDAAAAIERRPGIDSINQIHNALIFFA